MPGEPNYTQAFRTEEAVDIVEDGSGYTVGWNRAGEYMRYTVEVEYAGMLRASVPLRFIRNVCSSFHTVYAARAIELTAFFSEKGMLV